MEVLKIQAYKCPKCRIIYERENLASCCLNRHIKEDHIHKDFFENNFTLGQIEEKYKIYSWGSLTERQKEITKENCFIIRYLQLCRKPAYQIKKISSNGVITVQGFGSHFGYFSCSVNLKSLKDPHPKEELYIYNK